MTLPEQLKTQSLRASAARQAIVDYLTSYDVNDDAPDFISALADEFMSELDELTVIIEERSQTI